MGKLLKLFLDGKKGNIESKLELPETAETFLYEPECMQVFTNEDKKIKWLNDSGFSIYYQRGLKLLKYLQNGFQKEIDEIELEKKIKIEETEDRNHINEMLEKANINHNDSLKFKSYFLKYDPKDEPKKLSSFLYEHSDFQGSWRYSSHGIQIPKFSWMGFNDKCSSVRVFGETLCLCKHTWWRGSRVWIGGYPYREISYLGSFNDQASSSFSF